MRLGAPADDPLCELGALLYRGARHTRSFGGCRALFPALFVGLTWRSLRAAQAGPISHFHIDITQLLYDITKIIRQIDTRSSARRLCHVTKYSGSASKAVAAARYRGNSRACRSSGPARPYMARLRVFSRLICPSVWPLLQCSVIAFLMASMSLRNVRANRCIA